jgi:hypothetical protein
MTVVGSIVAYKDRKRLLAITTDIKASQDRRPTGRSRSQNECVAKEDGGTARSDGD